METKNCIEIVIQRDDGTIYVRSRKIEYNINIIDDGYGNIISHMSDVVELGSTQYYFKDLTEEELANKILEIGNE